MTLWKHIFNHSKQRARLFQRFTDATPGSVVFLEGGNTEHRLYTDTEVLFRPESNFYYVTGVQDPGCACALNLNTKEFVLFVPPLDDGYALWCGDFPSNSEYQQLTGADQVLYTTAEQIQQLLVDKWNTKRVFTLKNIPTVLEPFMSEFESVDNKRLYTELREARLRKLPEEIEAMRKINKISQQAHLNIMKNVYPGMNEAEAESLFTSYVLKAGCKHMSYNPIVAGENRGATLHYVTNDKPIKDGSLLLVDAGAELNCYASDITRTYPINGKFTEKQRQIYEIVLKANKQVIAEMKPGVSWVDMHRLAERIICQGLCDLGLLKGKFEDVLASRVTGFFFPHGLGHSLGIDVHDPPNRDGSFKAIDEPGIRFLRVHVTLEEGMVLTVEPGIYFIERMLKKAYDDPKYSPFLNKELIDTYMDFGGIRIEDNIVVTKDGVDNLTKDLIKEVADIEAVMKK
jgi:Xaa-Pro dipeptidase